MVDVDEERCIGRHRDHIGIAFQAGHERGLADGAAQAAFAGVLGDGIFADKDLVAGPVVFVVFVGVADEEFRIAVVVFVDNLHRAVLGIAAGPVVGDQLDVRIFGLDGIMEQRIALVVGRPAILVADLEILQPEWGGMPGLGAHGTPLAVGRPIGILDGVERILHVLIHLVHRDDFPVRHADIDAEEGVGIEILAELEVFVVAQRMRGVVLPDVVLGAAFGDIPDGLLPPVGHVHGVALNPAAARETDECRLEPDQHLAQVRPQPMAFPGGCRQHRDHVQPESARLLGADDQACRRVGFGRLHGQTEGLPVGAELLDLVAGIDLAVGAFQRDGQRSGESGFCPGGQRNLVTFALDHRHAVVAGIGNARPDLADVGQGHLERVRIFGTDRFFPIDHHADLGEAAADRGPWIDLAAILERAVADPLGINAAIGRQVDVLKKDAPQRWADLGPGLGDVDADFVFRRLCRASPHGGCRQRDREPFHRQSLPPRHFTTDSGDHLCFPFP